MSYTKPTEITLNLKKCQYKIVVFIEAIDKDMFYLYYPTSEGQWQLKWLLESIIA